MDLDTDTGLSKSGVLRKLAHTTWHDHLVMLLHVGAEIEHGLMVQYLYAAYSLDPDKVDARQRAMVEDWRETLLIIAKEEMGHLLTVQDVLSLLGAPFNLGRDDFPWDAPYYPFPFTLEPVSEDSLARARRAGAATLPIDRGGCRRGGLEPEPRQRRAHGDRTGRFPVLRGRAGRRPGQRGQGRTAQDGVPDRGALRLLERAGPVNTSVL